MAMNGVLFDEIAGNKPWEDEWVGMPEFNMQDLTSVQKIVMHFETEEDVAEFAKLIGQPISKRTRSMWFPEAAIGRIAHRLYVDEENAE